MTAVKLSSKAQTAPAPLALWGGVECTVVRIGERYRDQIVETGHFHRLDDLDRIAELGIRTLRYPILWETISPDAPDQCNWDWHDARLARLRDLGIQPIAGLIHHGSGPRFTNLLDPAFPQLFARHAAEVARRYPWIDLYTPVNEPLTTARFSALYGHWYPHARDYATFLRALVNQSRATVLAMQEIRNVNSAAHLVQTEDIGRTFATPALSYQAEHENERRWLSLDLLFGRVTRDHPWWGILGDHGIASRELEAFERAATPPDIIGINHYLTSERFLDEHVDGYPQHLTGGNGRDRYADVEAVRVSLPERMLGPAARLHEVWDRYGVPIVVTEVHHGCTRDEQLRWLAEVWRAAEDVRRQGVDVRAIALWSLFGTVDWNTLLAADAGIYEPGAYDIRGPSPRPTALATAARSLAGEGRFDHPVLDRPGWWQRDARFYRSMEGGRRKAEASLARRFLLIGGDDAITSAFSRVASERGLEHAIVSAHHPTSMTSPCEWDRIWAVVDLSPPSRWEREQENFISACAARHVAYVSCSPTFVFDGKYDEPYIESDGVSPVDADSVQAVARERWLSQRHSGSLIIRTGLILSPWDDRSIEAGNVSTHAYASANYGGRISFTYLPDLAHVTLDLMIDGDHGVRHLTNPCDLSVTALAQHPGWPLAQPPADPSLRKDAAHRQLGTCRGELMPPISSALDRFFAHRMSSANRLPEFVVTEAG